MRFIHAPPQPDDDGDERVALGEHTDFGSVTVLFNRVGGLQVLAPSSPPLDRNSSGGRKDSCVGAPTATTATGKGVATETWSYVRPLAGHAIVNLGDALVKMTGGVLRSSVHRVVAAPGEQAGATRHSVVYFARPEDDVVLRVLEGSERIEEEVRRRGGALGREREEREVSAKEWVLRRAFGRRAGGKWEDSLGTEGGRTARREEGVV